MLKVTASELKRLIIALDNPSLRAKKAVTSSSPEMGPPYLEDNILDDESLDYVASGPIVKGKYHQVVFLNTKPGSKSRGFYVINIHDGDQNDGPLKTLPEAKASLKRVEQESGY